MTTTAATARDDGTPTVIGGCDEPARAKAAIVDAGDGWEKTAQPPDSNYPITRLLNYPIHDRKGFTLIELLVVMSIVVLLATMVM
mgnify:CR=1 FL=1